ncbi:MAG TPA: 3'-5' exonuclease, partial [Halanaerobiales bacterium]|nr:3'-5' exonuclease [Halanaerobiales bacterium]
KKLRENNALDFDDLIVKTVELFLKYPLVLEYYQDRFLQILVDEYQDVNNAQYKLVSLLAEKHRNICVVGDPDQSIYGFRGADISNILNFEEDYPEARVIKLEQNYRSQQKILEAAHQVISHNTNRKKKKLWTDRGQGKDLGIYLAFDEKDEADYICRRSIELVEEGYHYRDIAVLYRTNAQSRVLEESLIKYAIPYQIIGGTRFYERMEIKDIIAYLQVLYNTDDDLSLQRIINRPRRGIGDATLGRLQNYAAQNGLSLYQAGQKAEEVDGLSGAYQKRVRNFFELLEKYRQLSEEVDVYELTDGILNETGYRQELEKEKTVEAMGRLENIEEFFSVIKDFQEKAEDESLRAFLEEVSLIADVDNLDDSGDYFTLMTLHSAKGLEFPVVFLAGMEKGIFPHSNSLEEEGGLEEERRLCYVGITRAMKEIYFTLARERMRFGERLKNAPSQFIKEISEELFGEGKEYIRGSRTTADQEYDDSGLSAVNKVDLYNDADLNREQKPAQSKVEAKNGKNYQTGERILHPKWGIGRIIKIEEDRGGGKKITVKFSRGVSRTLMAEYAPIKKI